MSPPVWGVCDPLSGITPTRARPRLRRELLRQATREARCRARRAAQFRWRVSLKARSRRTFCRSFDEFVEAGCTRATEIAEVARGGCRAVLHEALRSVLRGGEVTAYAYTLTVTSCRTGRPLIIEHATRATRRPLGGDGV